MDNELNSKIKRQAIPLGLIFGVILTVIGIVSFYLMISTTSIIVISAVPIILSFIVPLILAIIFSKNLRTKIGGFWNFRQATSGIFIILISGFLVQFIVRDMLFAKIIEPDMIQKMETAMVASVTPMLEKSNAGQETIDKKIEDIQKNFDEQKNLSIGKQIQAVVITIIFVFVLALILAAFLKKEGHVYDHNLDTDPTA